MLERGSRKIAFLRVFWLVLVLGDSAGFVLSLGECAGLEASKRFSADSVLVQGNSAG